MDSVVESLQLCQTKEIIQMSICSSAVKASGCEIFRGCFWQVEKQQEVCASADCQELDRRSFHLVMGLMRQRGLLVSTFHLLFFVLTSESQKSRARSAPP